MKYTRPTYRPPYEADTLLLQVTVGCAHNKCTFCTMYRGVKFEIEHVNQIEKDLQEIQQFPGKIKRIFLVNGDAFVLKGKRLKEIAEKVHHYLPEIEKITMYASINNIKHKTDEELAELAKLGIGDLWVGVETGHGKSLEYLNKGSTIEDAYEQLERLNKAGITFFYGFMFGAAGKGKGVENAEANAQLINTVKPLGIVPTTLSPNKSTQLAEDVANGTFELATDREVFEEQKKILELVHVPTRYMGIHVINTLSFDALLPRDKQLAIDRVDYALANMDTSVLDSVPIRHSI